MRLHFIISHVLKIMKNLVWNELLESTSSVRSIYLYCGPGKHGEYREGGY